MYRPLTATKVVVQAVCAAEAMTSSIRSGVRPDVRMSAAERLVLGDRSDAVVLAHLALTGELRSSMLQPTLHGPVATAGHAPRTCTSGVL